MLINIAAAFILVRKLGPSEYAFYQTLTKRGTLLCSLIIVLLGNWVYRYNAQRLPGSWEAGILVTIFSSIYAFLIGVLLAWYLGSGSSIVLLSGLAVAMFSAYMMMRRILNALRPVRFAVLPIIYRLIYTTLIVVLVYFASHGVIGALWSIVAAGSVAVILAFLWARESRPPPSNPLPVIGEWVRHSFVYAPAAVSSLLISLDALIIYQFRGSIVVAAFFATFMIFSLIKESVGAGVGYVTTYLLQGGSEERILRGLTILLALIVPLLVFIASHPVHVMYLINPRYKWASPVLAFHAVLVIASLFETYLASIAGGSIRGLARETAPELMKLSLIYLFSRTIYLLEIIIAAYTLTDSVSTLLAWSLSLSIASIISMTGYILVTPSLHFKMLQKHLLYLVTYSLLSLVIARIIAIPPPSPRFFDEVKKLILPFIEYSIATYAVIVLITPEIRQATKRVLRWARPHG